MSDPPGSKTLPGSNSPSMSEQCRSALNQALADQEREWRKGDSTFVEKYLEREPVLRSNAEAILDLIYKEVLLRCRRDEKPQFEEYARRFPDLADALGPIFEVHHALESDDATNSAFAKGERTLPATAPHEVSLTLPELPGYELLERLGHGGMGVVYKARQKSLGRIVALKMVLAGAHASPDAVARFRCEADAVAKLAHPNIVQIYEIGEHEGRPFLSLEFVDGGSLDKKLAGTPLPARDAARLVVSLAGAVHHAHLQGVVHRDLKPANILISPFSDGAEKTIGTPKITDFGLARLGAGSGQTQSGDILGTPSYMAPEQAAGRNSEIGPATDVYALGATLYELLTGRPPFRADNPLDTLMQVIDREPVSLTHLQPNVPRDLDTICLKCLQKAPSKRYESAEALADDLQRFLDGKPIHARQTAAWERGWKWAKRRPALAGLYVLAVASAIALGLHNVWLSDALNETEKQRHEAQKAQILAETAAEQRRLQLVQARMADGSRLLDEGDWFGALLPFADAYKLDEKDPKRAEMHRIRLSTILRNCPRLTQFWPHSGDVSDAEFSADGRRVLTASGNTAHLFDAETGASGPSMMHGKSIAAIALSPDGLQVATAADDKTVQIWDSATGKRIASPLDHAEAVEQIAFTSNGDRIVTATRNVVQINGDATIEVRIQLWQISTGKSASQPLKMEASPASQVALSSDGRWAATAGLDTTKAGRDAVLTVWELATGKKVFAARNASAGITKICFSANASRVAAAYAEGTARVWDCVSQKETAHVRQGAPLLHLAFSPNGRRLATAGIDGVVNVWDTVAGKAMVTLRHGPAFTHAVAYVAFSPDGRHAVTAGADNTARVWDATTGILIAPRLRHGDKVTWASFGRDGRQIVTACADRAVRIWDLASGQLAPPPLEHEDGVAHASLNSHGSQAVTAGIDKVARVWDLTSGRCQGPPLVHTHELRYAAFAIDGRIITTSENNRESQGEASVWDAPTGKLLFRRATAQSITGVMDTDLTVRRAWFSSDASTLLALDGTGAARVWKVSNGKAVTGVLEHKSAVTGVSFSGDGRHVVTETFLPNLMSRALLATGESPAGLSKLIQVMRPAKIINVWETAAGRRVASIGPWSDVGSLSFRRAVFCPDDRMLLIISDGEARLWNIADVCIVRRFRKPGAAVDNAALSPDGQTLATASDDDTVQLWNATNGEQIPTPVHFLHGEQKWPPLFSPDGRLLVVSIRPAGVRVWDAATGDPVSPPLRHPGQVESATFSSDGRLLLTASDRAARPWRLSADDRNADEWLRMAQMLSCSRLHSQGGQPVPLSADELRSVWDELHRSSANAFVVPMKDLITWHAEAARACEKLGRWDAALFQLERLAVLDPERMDLFARRGRANAETGRWTSAAADFEKVASFAADKYQLWYRHALVRLHLGEQDAYKRTCAEMLDRFESSKDLDAAQLAAWTSSLAPVPQSLGDRSAAAAKRAVRAHPRNHARLLTLGAALFRAHRYADAVRTLEDANRMWSKDDNVWDWLYLSMAHHYLGNTDLAKSNFDKAARWIDQRQVVGADGIRAATLFWSDRLELSVLRKEAEGYLRDRPSKKPKG